MSCLLACHLAYDRYECSRVGVPLVVIPGLFGSRVHWVAFAKSYNEMTGREVILLDCRNHGDSQYSPEMTFQLMAYDIEKLLIQLNIHKVILLGHSLGGKVAMEMTLSRPNCVESLIIVDEGINPLLEEVRHDLKVLIKAMLNVNLDYVKTKKDAESVLGEIVQVPDISSYLLNSLRFDRLNEFTKLTWPFNLEAFLNNFEQITGGVSLDGRAKYEGEAMFVAGEHSTFYRSQDLNHIKTIFPRAQLKVVVGAGHFLYADKPDEFLKIVQDFRG